MDFGQNIQSKPKKNSREKIVITKVQSPIRTFQKDCLKKEPHSGNEYTVWNTKKKSTQDHRNINKPRRMTLNLPHGRNSSSMTQDSEDDPIKSNNSPNKTQPLLIDHTQCHLINRGRVSVLPEGYTTQESDNFLLEYLDLLELDTGPSEMTTILKDYTDFNHETVKEQYFNDLPLKKLYSSIQMVKD